MQFKLLALAGLVSTAASQSLPTLVQALNSSSQLSALYGLVSNQTALVSALGSAQNITVLAPDNNAIAAFVNRTMSSGMMLTNDAIQAVLSYHVIMGGYANFSSMPMFLPTMLNNASYSNVTGGQRVEIMNTTAYSGLKANSSVNATGIQFTGGYIHVINSVLSIPTNVSSTLTAFNLTSAYGALQNSSLLSAVNALPNSTFFIPNNQAFRNIGSALPNLTMAQIQSILQYHVVNGTVAYSTNLMNMTVPSMQGNSLNITVRNASSVFVNGARVVIPDVLVANGVVHVIDAVLNPNMTMGANSSQSAGTPQFSGASSATEEPFTSGVPRPTSSINTGSIAATATGSSSSGGAWAPKATGAVGAAALGGLALLLQL